MRTLEGMALSSFEEFTLLLLEPSSENKLPGNKGGFGGVIHAGEKYALCPCGIALQPSACCYLWMCISFPFYTMTITYSQLPETWEIHVLSSPDCLFAVGAVCFRS